VSGFGRKLPDRFGTEIQGKSPLAAYNRKNLLG
jgi:hypothetical protein